MPQSASDIAFTPSVKAIQSQRGSRESYERMEKRGGWQTRVTQDLQDFLSEQDMFYLGTASADGQPYIQYRGGPPGFLKVLDGRTLGFADFAGNQQYITLGNLAENQRAFIFLIDYVHRRRIKLWGEATVIDGDEALQSRLVAPEYPGRAERAILFQISAWDVNCPQHIHRRLPAKHVEPQLEELQVRNSNLAHRLHEAEAKLAALGRSVESQEGSSSH